MKFLSLFNNCVSPGGKATVRLEAGDRIRIMTPGAGGFGVAQDGEGRQSGDKQSPKRQQHQPEQQMLHQTKGSVFEYRSRQEGA